jgi:nitroimidazol reductase NimA-like FMN-containing flavoprotein (pyridoxamine 5'-phosphate oxidase superfamily)
MHNPPSERTRLVRRPQRGAYEREVIHAILDEALVCHVGIVHEGAPRVLPTAFARAGERLYVHGSTANRMLRSLCGGEACITVTLLDGLVLARSAFHQSVNYRSVVIYGRGEEVTDPQEKRDAMRRIVEHVIPGRFADVRPPSDEELRRTLVVRVSTEEASAKLRGGGPIDDEQDHALDCWAGEIPLRLAALGPVGDGRLREGIEAPAYARNYRRPGAGGSA